MNPRHKIDIERLRKVCLAPEDYFHSFGEVIETKDGPLIYIDRGASVLGIAHLDAVSTSQHFVTVETPGAGTAVFNDSLDDRLGAYILLDVLPSVGIKCDVLLTTGEEMGRSSAAYFDKPDKKLYNWMFQFDRAGMDVVLYEYEDDKLEKMLTEAGFIVSPGLFSDISSMEHLKIKGMNFGCAYYNNHSKYSHAFVDETLVMIDMFQYFYERYKDTPMPHVPSLPTHSSGRTWQDWEDGDWEPMAWARSKTDVLDDATDWDLYEELMDDLTEKDNLTVEEAHEIAYTAANKMWDECLECGRWLGPKDKDCPYCGSERRRGNVSIHELTDQEVLKYLM